MKEKAEFVEAFTTGVLISELKDRLLPYGGDRVKNAIRALQVAEKFEAKGVIPSAEEVGTVRKEGPGNGKTKKGRSK